MYNTYDDFIKKEVESFKYYGTYYDTAIKYIPNFFKLLCDILDENVVDFDYRVEIYCAIAYLVIPNDVLPEDIYGSEGYMDDVYVLSYVLKELLARYRDIVVKHWNSAAAEFKDEDIDIILNVCYDTSKELLDKKGIADKTLEFAGLKRP